ncbi:MAG: ABC transporter ATP-binding protein, partial [Limisphaerales bacterium]
MNETAENRPILLAQALRKSYVMGGRNLEVLAGIDLAVTRGEFVALRGASGAGKSTLLHLLGGLDLPNAGEILFDGKNLASLSPGALAQWRNRSVGFVFQAYHLLPELTALENVMLPARMGRVAAAATATRAAEVLARVGLAQRMEHRPWELSGGEQQRVAIARALVNSPDLILADEPTGNLDSRSGEEIIHLLQELRSERRATLIIATHDSGVASRAPR